MKTKDLFEAKVLTFDQFVASKKKVLAKDVDFFRDVYAHDKAIEMLLYAGTKCAKGLWCGVGITVEPDGKYHLAIGNRDWISKNLASLEKRLYKDWYLPEYS